MEYRRLGNAGLKVSALSFGSWVTFGNQLDDDLAYDCMKEAWDAGVNFFDNAEVYAGGQAEVQMGRALRRAGWRRAEVVVSTKIFWGGKGPNDIGLSRKRIVEGLDASLERLQLDHVDLLFAHRPDPDTPIEETVRAMDHVVRQGKAHYWGTSEWTAEQVQAAWNVARQEHLTPPQMEQPEYNMFRRDRVEVELQPLYAEIGLGTTIWSPLASGLLTGKYSAGIPADSRFRVDSYSWLLERLESDEGKKQVDCAEQLRPIAEELDCSLAQLALAWCLANQDVSTVITGASKPEQVRENMKALDVTAKLDAAVLAQIEAILGNRPAGSKRQ